MKADVTFHDLPLDAIVASKTNPRTHFDPSYLAQLRDSIADKGVVSPILVRPHVNGRPAGERFEIVAGECRVRASRSAGRMTIPAIVRELTDDQALEIQLVENVHRRDLTPLEQARGYRQLIDSNPTKHSAESIAARLGLSPQWVWDRMKLNDLHPAAKTLLERERMSVGHAILIARLKPEDQLRVIDHEPMTEGIGGNREGLWRQDTSLLDDETDEKARKADPTHGLQPVSVRELQKWIDDHIRFDVKHAAKAVPFEFEPLAAQVADAVAQPGRGKKVIAISFEHYTQPDARSDEERTYGPQSWRRADGSKKSQPAPGYVNKMLDSPTCEFAVLGVVAAGERRGQAFDVCVARDRCEVHWKTEVAEKRKREQAKASGKPSATAAAKKRADDREARERDVEEQRAARWKAFSANLKKAVLAAPIPATLPKPLYAAILKNYKLPATTKPAHLAHALLRRALASDFDRYMWDSNEREYVAWAKLLGVDVKACEPAPVQTSGATAGKNAKAKK